MEANGRKLPASVIEAIQRGKKIEAIKHLRKEWGVDLKTAKETVDSIYSDVRRARGSISDPSLGRSVVVEESSSRRFTTIVLLGVVAAALYFFLGR